jgi:hypothetical protein
MGIKEREKLQKRVTSLLDSEKFSENRKLLRVMYVGIV